MNTDFQDRLQAWIDFRETLETSQDPLQDTIDYYNKYPLVSIHTDPWTPETWPTPWELISENEYCQYCILLGICYTLQLTDRLKNANYEIHIGIDADNALSETIYLLYVNDRVIGYDTDKHIAATELPSTFKPQMSYPMPNNY